jgi:hypothetical protein
VENVGITRLSTPPPPQKKAITEKKNKMNEKLIFR